MSEAQNFINKKELTFIKTKIPNLDENKLKSLEARLIGPSSDGNMPAEFEPLMEIDVDHIKSSKLKNYDHIFLTLRIFFKK
jgi:hypothetical protein